MTFENLAVAGVLLAMFGASIFRAARGAAPAYEILGLAGVFAGMYCVLAGLTGAFLR